MGKVKIFDKRRGWLWFSRNANNANGGYVNWLYSITKVNKRCFSSFSNSKHRKNEKHKEFRLLKDIKGGVTSIELLIYIPIICFLLFNGVDYYITSVQHNNLENRKNYYLDIMRIEGTFSNDLKEQIESELDNMGFTDVVIEAIKYSGGTEVPIYSDEYVFRDIENPDESRMKLAIQVKPKFTPFIFGKLLGVNQDDNFYFVVKGEALSEKSYFENE